LLEQGDIEIAEWRLLPTVFGEKKMPSVFESTARQ
jgi:hypothetical protein